MRMGSLVLVTLFVASRVPALAVPIAGSADLDQETKAAAPESRPRPAIPLKVTLTVSRYEGDKKVGSLPYSLEVVANDARGAKLRMGVEVPVPVTTIASPQSGGPATPPTTSYQYRNVGTNIDCRAEGPEDGRYRVFLAVEQSSFPPTPPSGRPTNTGEMLLVREMLLFRTFSTDVRLLLRPGQAAQYVSATDPVTGESMRVDVAVEPVR